MLQVKALEAGYGALKVLKGVDLEVRSGEIVTLIGQTERERPPS